MSRIEEAILNLRNAVVEETGKEGLLKIGFSHETFDRFVIDIWKRRSENGYYSFSYQPSDMSDLTFAGVRVVACYPDSFRGEP